METAQQKLADLRASIDTMDARLSQLLIERIAVIREVAALKAEHWPNNCHIRPGREGQMHRALAARFAVSAFPPLAALAIWRQLIGASTHLESPLNITSLTEYGEHVWLAREYFGVQVGVQTVATIADAIHSIRAGGSNIMILPDPSGYDWWKYAGMIREAGLYIFAALPVVAGNVPVGTVSAVALAALVPEDSGDDISYHVENCQLTIREGFHNDDAGGIFLGAHPRQITIGA